jgi:hypothetical protein
MTIGKHKYTKNISDILESDEFQKDLSNAWNAKVTAKEKRLDDLYKYIQTYVNFEDYLNDLEKRKQQEISLKPDEYIDSINEEYDLVEVAFKHGTIYLKDVSNKLKSLNMFTSSFANFKGYIFGIACGQGLIQWRRWRKRKRLGRQ